ncbi:MAG: hypothetical protein ACE5DY_08130 [Mariprofundaceae bacterium]
MLESGVIDLNPLYAFVKKDGNQEIPHRSRDKDIYLPYKELVEELLSCVPCEAGWYVWYNQSLRKAIYVGQSSKGKTSHLHSRIKEELLEEYTAFWLTVDPDSSDIIREKYNNKYSTARADKKTGSDLIMWVAYPAGKRGELDVVEQKLIKNLNPEANSDIRDYSDISCEIYGSVHNTFLETLTMKHPVK